MGAVGRPGGEQARRRRGWPGSGGWFTGSSGQSSQNVCVRERELELEYSG
jgi:hypothetical protein